MNDKQWNDLMVEHELAYLRGDLATSSPESYTIDEMKVISDGMFASTAEADAAMRTDFETLPDFAKKKLLDMLGAPGTPEREWRENILLPLDRLPDSPPFTA